MEKVVGRKGGKKPEDGKKPTKPTINATVTKDDLKLFGKETVEGVTKAMQKRRESDVSPAVKSFINAVKKGEYIGKVDIPEGKTKHH